MLPVLMSACVPCGIATPCRPVWCQRHRPSQLALLHRLRLWLVMHPSSSARRRSPPSARRACYLAARRYLHERLACWFITRHRVTSALLRHASTCLAVCAGDAGCDLLPNDVPSCEDWVNVTSTATQPCPPLTCCASTEGVWLQDNACAPAEQACFEMGPNDLGCMPLQPTGCPAGVCGPVKGGCR